MTVHETPSGVGGGAVGRREGLGGRLGRFQGLSAGGGLA